MRRRSAGRRLAWLSGTTRRARVRRWVTRAVLACGAGLFRRRRTCCAGACAVAAGAAGVAGGPIAAIIAGVYAAIGAGAWYARSGRLHDELRRAQAVEIVGALAAELRAGLPVRDTGGPVELRLRDPEAVARVAAARRISERLGAPLADLLDRVEADLRAGQRLRATVAAQAAGVRATGMLLAVLPLAGVALGTSLGTDPVHQLLHTPLGAACVLAALAAQCAGLFWQSRLTNAVMAEAR